MGESSNMAHCNASSLHTPSYAVHIGSAHDGKFQDLLPPRKRLLAGFKHLTASTLPILGSSTSTLAQCQHGEACNNTAPSSTSPPPRSLLLHSPTQKCFSCGDGCVLLHRVPCLAGSTSYLCSSCVLLSNKKSYCVLCLQIIKEGLLTPSSSSSSPSVLTCRRCQRLTHLDCALKIWSPSLQGASLTLCKDCHARNIGQSSEPPRKKQKMASIQRSKQAVVSACEVKLPVVNKEAAIAAKIVALAAKRDFFEAKQRAAFLAKAAACASAHAKAALDNVYKTSQRQAEKEELANVRDIECKNGMSGISAKPPRCLKRRALSAIVASETLSRDSTVGNGTAKIEKSKKHRRTLPHTDNGEGMPPKEAAMEVSGSRSVQNVKLGIKRRKTLSSLTNTHAAANLKVSKLPIKKHVRPSSSSTKGKLGAIVSQVLALSKISKTSKVAEKERGSDEHRIKVGYDVVHEIQENTCRVPAVLDGGLPSSGMTARADICKTSHHGIVASREERVQSSRTFEEWLQYTEAMRANSWGMIQEQLAKNRLGGCETIGPQQDRKLLNCLTKTMPARKSMYANVVPAVMGASKQC